MNDPHSAAEEVLWSGSISHWHYALRWFFVIVLLIPLVDLFFVAKLGTAGPIAQGVLGLLALGLIVSIFFARRARRYVVTNRRVTVEFGLVSKESNEISIEHIRSINLTTTGLSGLFGIGRLEFSSAATDDAEVIFWNVPGAKGIRDLVRSQQKE